MTTLLYSYFFCLGAAVGSFLNVCIFRLPLERSIVRPRSFCPQCTKTIAWYDNIPIISFIALLGKCRFCKSRISWQYPLVELLTALLFVLLFHRFSLSLALFVYAAFVSALIAITFIDLQHYIIPDKITFPGIVVGVGLSFFVGRSEPTQFLNLSLWSSLLGVLVGGLTIYLVNLMSILLFKKVGMGGGDVKLLAMIGAFLGWRWTLVAFIAAVFAGGVAGALFVIARLVSRKGYSPFSHYIPFGPCLAAGAGLVLLFADYIRLLVLRLYNISL